MDETVLLVALNGHINRVNFVHQQNRSPYFHQKNHHYQNHNQGDQMNQLLNVLMFKILQSFTWLSCSLTFSKSAIHVQELLKILNKNIIKST